MFVSERNFLLKNVTLTSVLVATIGIIVYRINMGRRRATIREASTVNLRPLSRETTVSNKIKTGIDGNNL
jgi:hypothetical protein